MIRVRLGDKSFTAPEISAYILRELKAWAEAYFKEPVDRAVITVPAYFNDAQRQATKDAGRLAGLEVLRLVNEPTAAALAYGLHKQKRGHVAVYDFGGGTFDISILKLISTNEGDIYQVLATNGDTHLGGDDIDNALLGLARREIREKFGVEFDHRGEAIQTLRKSLIRAKHELSTAEKTDRAISAGIEGYVHPRNHARGIRRTDSPDHRAHYGAGENGAGGCQARAERNGRSGAGGRLDAHSAGAQDGGRLFPARAALRAGSRTKWWRWARRCRRTFSRLA